MANRNNLPHLNGNDVDRSSDFEYIENEEIRIRRNIPKSTPNSQSVTDERSVDPQHMTSQQIDTLVIYKPDHLGATIPARYWLILIVLCLGIYQYWYLLVFLFVINQLLIYKDRSDAEARDAQSWYSNFLFHHIFDPGRDAQADGRTARPTDEDIEFFESIEITNNDTASVEDTHSPDGRMLDRLNNVRHRDLIINHENRHSNEDVTLSNNTNRISPIEVNIEITANEPVAPRTVFDDPTCNINPLSSTDDNVQTSQTVPIAVDHRVQLDEGNNFHDVPPTTPVPLTNEASEIGENVHAPGEFTCEMLTHFIRRTATVIPKSSNLVRPLVKLVKKALHK